MSMTVSPISIEFSVRPETTPFSDTNTVSYVVKDPGSRSCAVIDSVLAFDYAAGRIEYRAADAIIAFVRGHGLVLDWLIKTHLHADHLAAAPYIQSALGGKIGIGEQITMVQDTFGKIFNEGPEFQRDGSQFDRLFADGDSYAVGGMTARVMHTPGHTPACTTHVIGDAAFVGETLLMPDSGTARADFPGGDPGQLYASIRRILALLAETRLFVCHDYGPNGRAIRWETTASRSGPPRAKANASRRRLSARPRPGATCRRRRAACGGSGWQTSARTSVPTGGRPHG